MPHHLNVTIRFLTDRYHGGDWPPSPARLFQALVAGTKTGAPAREWSDRHQRALEWLEGLGPPEILARPGQPAKPYTLFVPNNSLAAGLSTKTSKPVAPRILVNHTLGEADVVYRWPIEDEVAACRHLPTLDRVASQLRALGWGVDFAAATAHLADASPPAEGLEHFTPDAQGDTLLRTPSPGLLAHLEKCYQDFTHRITKQGVNPYTRPTRLAETRYGRAHAARRRRSVAFELQTLEGRPFAMRWDQAQTVAAWLRHAAGEALQQEGISQQWIDSFILGHTGPDLLGHRLSFVPLPSVGHIHSDGGIRRVLIVEPPTAAGSEREALDLLEIKLAGWLLTDERGEERAVLAPVRDKGKVLPFYRSKARIWQTVTPVVLHGHNTSHNRISLTKTGRLLSQAFDDAGFPAPCIGNMTFQPAPYWPGSGGAASIRVPRHLEGWPRLHVQVEFKEAIEGPVLAGIGRHYGIGLFAAPPEQPR
jgi:CRISPR-associated protein Csb2